VVPSAWGNFLPAVVCVGREDTTNYETCSLLQQNIVLYRRELLNNSVSISDYTESLFYLTIYTRHFPPVDRRASWRSGLC